MAVQAIKSGWLYKAPPKFNTLFLHWNKRHFDLFDNGDLTYSRSSAATDAVLGLIRLSEIEHIVDAEELISCLHSIALYNPITKRTFFLRGENGGDIDSWCKAIQKHVPAYKELAIDARPVCKILPEHIMESLPHRQGKLLAQHLEYFSKEKSCEIKDGKFRIYSNQYKDQLDHSYSLLPCKGVQDLTDACKGKSNNFQFRIEFMDQRIQPLVLGAKTPFDRQGWIVCLMKTITILSKHQGCQNRAVEAVERPRSMSVPPLFADLPREHLEEQMTQLLGELDMKEHWLSELKDDKQQLNTKMNTLKNENERLKRSMTTSRSFPRTPQITGDVINSNPSPLLDPSTRMKYTRPNNIKNFTSSPISLNGDDSRSSSGSEGSNFKDSRPSAKTSTGSNISITESLCTQLIDLCRGLGCLEKEENADHVANLRQYIERQNDKADTLIHEKDEDIRSLNNQIQDQLDKRVLAFESLKLQHELEFNQSMEALREQHKKEIYGCQDELQRLKRQHSCQVKAVEEENKKLCDDIMQLKTREKEITQETEVKRIESETITQQLSAENEDLKRTLGDRETQLKALLPKKSPPKPPLP